MATPTATVDNWAPYFALIQEFPLRPIQDDVEHEQAMTLIERLIARDDLAPAESAFFQVLARLVQEYEDAHIDLPPVTGRDVIRYLMEAHHLQQKDLVDVFKAESVVSEVLSGRRSLSLNHVRRLSAYFGLPADVFIDRQEVLDDDAAR